MGDGKGRGNAGRSKEKDSGERVKERLLLLRVTFQMKRAIVRCWGGRRCGLKEGRHFDT